MLITSAATVRVATAPVGLRDWLPSLAGQAVVVSSTAAAEGFLSTPVCRQHLAIRPGDRLTPAVPSAPPERLRHLDQRGLIRVGSIVREGDRLIGMVRPTGSTATPDEQQIRSVFGRPGQDETEASLIYPHRDPAVVTHATLSGPHEAVVEFAVRRELCAGDTLRARTGDCCVVAEIRAAAEMPTVDDLPVDVLLLPDHPLAEFLGSEGRMAHRSMHRRRLGPGRASRHGRLRLSKVTALQEEKWLARSRVTDDYTLIGQMPMLGKVGQPGQRLPPGCAAALLAAGYRANLLEMMTVKSDELAGRRAAFEAVIRPGNPVRPAGAEPETAARLRLTLQAACLDVSLPAPGDAVTPFRVGLLGDRGILDQSFGVVRVPETIDSRSNRPVPHGLCCPRIFGPEKDGECSCGKYRGMKYNGMVCDRCGVKVGSSLLRRRRLGHLALAGPVVHPWLLDEGTALARLTGAPAEDLRRLALLQAYLVTDAGGSGLEPGTILPEAEATSARRHSGDLAVTTGGEAVRELLRRKGAGADGIVLNALPVLPPDLRPVWMEPSGRIRVAPLNALYAAVIRRSDRLHRLTDLSAPEVVIQNERRALQRTVNDLFERGGEDGDLRECLADALRRVISGLLERPVEHVARSVAIPDAAVPRGEIVLPAGMAQTLYRPQAIRVLLATGHAETIDLAIPLLDHQADEPPARQALADAVASLPLLVVGEANRLAVLWPKVGDREAVAVNPEDGRALGLRFSGERVMLHLPLSAAAAAELAAPRAGVESGSTLTGFTPGRLIAAWGSGHAEPYQPLDQIALGAVSDDLGTGAPIRITVPMAGPGRGAGLETPVAVLNLSVRGRTCLSQLGVKTLGELVGRTAEQLRESRNMGTTPLQEIREKLAGLGLKLRGDP